MIPLADIICEFKADLGQQYGRQLLPGHRRALSAIERCGSPGNTLLQAVCPDCHHDTQIPCSCGHRLCPRCQQRDSQLWIERQRQKLLPVTYFMITFTLPAQLRALAWSHQRVVYDLLFKISWQVLSEFGLNDKQLQGKLGATAVLHTHSRKLDYHPHIHLIIPAGAVNRTQRLWRRKRGDYLFNQRNLATVFRAKWLQSLKQQGLQVKDTLPADWVVDCKAVGGGDKALTYLGKYLYRGVIREKDILCVKDGQVTFRYTDNRGNVETRRLPGGKFLWLLLRHVLPRGFRRARDYGFLHANSKRLIQLIQLWLHVVLQPLKKRPPVVIKCPHCGQPMRIVATGLTQLNYRKLKSKDGLDVMQRTGIG